MEHDYVTLTVKLWLQDQKHTHWLLVLDNLDDLESWNYKEYIPGGLNGSIVLTSRRQDLEWLESGRDIAFLSVQELHSDEAVQLLLGDSRMSRLDLEGGLVPCFPSMLIVASLIKSHR